MGEKWGVRDLLARAASSRPGLILILAAFSIPAALLINHAVPSPYMDEEFHIRQAQRFCQGDFGYWDPKITTFPGLYILSLAYAGALLPLGQLLGFRLSMNDLCQPEVLRSVNIILFLICGLLFRHISLHFDPEKNPLRASVKALALSLYPLHWFFNFLYYTELGSATAVMAMYLAALKHSYWSSALFGAVSILLRQTNAVWIIFVLCVGVFDFLQNDLDGRKKAALQDQSLILGKRQTNAHRSNSTTLSIPANENGPRSHGKEESAKDGVRERKSAKQVANVLKGANHATPKRIPSGTPVPSLLDEGIFAEVWMLMKNAWFRWDEVLWNFGPYLLVLLTFIGFVVKNGSIVVGDKNAHKVSPHFAQILYFGLVSSGFQAAAHLSPQNLKHLLWVLQTSSRAKSVVSFLTTFSAAFIAVQFYGPAHPYLLADNRHYTFYFWKDVLQRHWGSKYMFIPLYIFSWWSIIVMLGRTQKVLWVLAFCLAVVGVLVPTPLLEFRYYNIPFYFLFLHSPEVVRHGKEILALTLIQFLTIDVLCVYIFLFWPFTWSSEPEKVQRFMW